MAVTIDGAGHDVKRADYFFVSPLAVQVNWKRNISRGGVEPPVDENLIRLANDLRGTANKGFVTGENDGEDYSTGQLQPIVCRLLKDRKLEILLGFRRLRAALYLVESGIDPDFKIKVVTSKMSDSEATVANMIENMEREDPKPIQTARAFKHLMEDHGLSVANIAARFKRSLPWVYKIIELLDLPEEIQEAVEKQEISPTVASAITKLETKESQIEAFDSVKASGQRLTVADVNKKVREEQFKKVEEVKEEKPDGSSVNPPANAGGKKRGRPPGPAKSTSSAPKPNGFKAVPLTLKEIKTFLESLTGPADAGHAFASLLLDFFSGKETEAAMRQYWKLEFEEYARLQELHVNVKSS